MDRSELEAETTINTPFKIEKKRDYNRKYFPSWYTKNRKCVLLKAYLSNKACPQKRHQKYLRYREKELAHKKEWYRNNKDIHRNKQFMRLYGITTLEYDRIYQIQCGQCKICGKHQISLNKPLCVDHDHRRKKVRGLLCHCCNSMIGYSKESISNLKKAIEYLEVHHG